jgi:hypothetical protein
MKETLPTLIARDSANHRLELSAGAMVKSVNSTHRFKAYIDKRPVVHNASLNMPKYRVQICWTLNYWKLFEI